VSMAYYYEDFAIGQRFSSNTCRMDKERMMAFAAEFDPQPQHISERDARSSQFGALVASGWHTAAVSMRLFIAEALPPIAGGGQGLGIEALSWPHPVRPGDELRVVTEVTATRPSRSRPDNDDGPQHFGRKVKISGCSSLPSAALRTMPSLERNTPDLASRSLRDTKAVLCLGEGLSVPIELAPDPDRLSIPQNDRGEQDSAIRKQKGIFNTIL
jgi:acyl dehydratase